MCSVVEDIRTIAAVDELYRDGMAARRKPLFLFFRKRARLRYKLQEKGDALAKRYDLPAWRMGESCLAEILDAFDARVDYPAASLRVPRSESDEGESAIDKILADDSFREIISRYLETPEDIVWAIERMRSEATDLERSSERRFRYLCAQADIIKELPPLAVDVRALLNVEEIIGLWSDGEANSDPSLSRLRAAISTVLPEEHRKKVSHLNKRFVEFLHRFEQEIQWAGVISRGYLPPKSGNRVAHEGPVQDWGKKAVEAYLVLQSELGKTVAAIDPLLDIAFAYDRALRRYRFKTQRLFETSPVKVYDLSPDERKRRKRDRKKYEDGRSGDAEEKARLIMPGFYYREQEADDAPASPYSNEYDYFGPAYEYYDGYYYEPGRRS